MILYSANETVQIPVSLLGRWGSTTKMLSALKERGKETQKKHAKTKKGMIVAQQGTAAFDSYMNDLNAYGDIVFWTFRTVESFRKELGEEIFQQDYVVQATLEEVRDSLIHQNEDGIGFNLDTQEIITCGVCQKKKRNGPICTRWWYANHDVTPRF